jgi:hypothetical protein
VHAVDALDVLATLVRGVETYERSPVLETIKVRLL